MTHPEDLSPGAMPFESRMRQIVLNETGAACPEVACTVYEYVDLAKRMLLELRVRDFTAADVVALATIMEARDRSKRQIAARGDHDQA